MRERIIHKVNKSLYKIFHFGNDHLGEGDGGEKKGRRKQRGEGEREQMNMAFSICNYFSSKCIWISVNESYGLHQKF